MNKKFLKLRIIAKRALAIMDMIELENKSDNEIAHILGTSRQLVDYYRKKFKEAEKEANEPNP